MTFEAELVMFVCFSGLFVAVSCGKIFIDRYTLEFDRKLGNWSTSFINVNNVSCTNLTIQPFQTITKFVAYVKVNLAENENDREYKREFVRTVVDVAKATAGEQMNFLVKGFFENLKPYMDFKFQMPMPPRKYNFVNFYFRTDYVPWMPNTRGSIEFRCVGKIAGSKATKFFACLKYYGGYLN